MKRLLLILLAALLFAGCQRNPSAQETTVPPPTETHGLYMPDSVVEQQNSGAVRAYFLREDTCFDLTGIGSNLLAIGQKGLTVLAGEQGEVVARLETGEVTSVSVMDTAATGIAYYLPANRQVIVRNPQLEKVTQLTLPEVIVGKPVISLGKNEVYYSTGGEIRALNMSTGISRLLRQQTTSKQTLLDAYFEGEVLLCQLTNEAGNTNMEYISSETGQTFCDSQGVSNLQTDGAEFFAYWQDGALRQAVFGTRGGEAQRFLASTLPEGKIGGRVAFPAAKGGGLCGNRKRTGA